MGLHRCLAAARTLFVAAALFAASGELAASEMLRSEASEPMLGTLQATREGSPSSVWSFRRALSARAATEAGVTAVAAGGDLIAIGDAAGVALSVGGGAYRRVLRSGLVNDLHFGSDGALWVAALDGLQHRAADGRVSERSPGTGELARAATRVRDVAGVVAVGTAAGLFLSHDGEQWSARVGSLPAASVRGLALRRDSSAGSSSDSVRIEIWAISGGFPWRVIAQRDQASVRVVDAQRVSIPGRPGGVAPVDVALGLPGAGIVVLFPQALALADSVDGPWKIVRPAVPPGASLRRVAGFADRLWLATDRGLLEAEALVAPFRRSAAPAGSAFSSAFAASSGALFVASQIGLLEGRPSAQPVLTAAMLTSAAARGGKHRPERSGPAIAAVQQAALRYLELGPERVRELRSGLDLRGWLPELSVRLDYASDRDEREDWDQSFVSGDTRRLYDYQRDRHRDLGGSVELSWDLGDTLYQPEAIELSREARQRIALRDDALDEINQLYFERRSVLARLDALTDSLDPFESRRLELRAQELAAGLDGWTGGWFSAALAEASP